MNAETSRTTGTADTAPRSTNPPARDVVRREWFLTRLSWHLQDHPGREAKQIVRDLRGELTSAAADVGMRQAVRDLGHPLVLAEGYRAHLGRRVPRWTAGAVAAGLAVAFLVYLGFAYAFGTLDTLEALGGGTVTRYPFGAETVFTSGADGIAVESTFTWQGVVIFVLVAAVAFVLGSRAWRALG
ncbi:hypothetical protein ICW40_19605 [Actinotalea ferrariae]|uniref:hypothetical protein n=1 Tax=Actinotalea ferrariae TaxID=1386098 RepID=UPI001C8B61E1|nr:hypothetical protein [Actinotalea ferrariae]MBX9247001.1 hypothetical protein [Actinotalea ferrariae]